MKAAPPIRVIPSGKVYRQMFDAETQLVRALIQRELTRDIDVRQGDAVTRSVQKAVAEVDSEGFAMLREEKPTIPLASVFTTDAPGLLGERARTWIAAPPNEPNVNNPIVLKKDIIALNWRKLAQQKQLNRESSNTVESRLVYGLPDIVEAPKRGSDIIERVAGGRKLRHDQAVADLHDELSVISKNLEPKIKLMGEILIEQLDKDQLKISELFKMTENDNTLVEYTRADLDSCWSQITDLSRGRYSLIDDFYASVLQLEDTRLNDIQKLFRTYSEKLTNICHLMADDLRDFLELESQQINQSLLSNRRCYADVYHQLTAQDLFAEKKRGAEWTNRIQNWRDLHIFEKIKQFRQYMNSDQVKEPLATKECMSRLIAEQRLVHDQQLKLLHSLEELQPPHSTKNAIYAWNKNTLQLAKQLDELNQKYFNKLYLEYENLCNRNLGFIENTINDLVEREVGDRAYIKEIINNECLPIVGIRQTSFESLLEIMDRKLEQHNIDLLDEMRKLFKYCQGAAHLWDVHELGLARQERTLHEKLDSCRLHHDRLNQKLENELDIIMDSMRQEATERDLDIQLEKSLVMFANIKTGYDDFHASQVAIVNIYPVMMKEELKRYDRALCSYFEVGRQPSSEKSKDSVKSTPRQDTKLKNKSEQKEIDKKMESPRFTKKPEKNVEPKVKKAKKSTTLPKAVGQVLSTKNGTEFYIQKKASASPDHEIPAFKGSKHPPPPSSDQDSDAKGKRTAPVSDQGNKERQVDGSVAGAGGEEEVPIYLSAVVIKKEFIDKIKKSICLNFLNHYEEWTEKGIVRANGVTLTKIEELNSELDLRLHLHKPRSSRAQLDVHHVRAAELVMHSERVTRHVQGGRQTLAELRRDFTNMQNNHADVTANLRKDIEALQNIFVNATKSSKLISLSNQLQVLKDKYMATIRSSLRVYRQKLDDTLQMLRTSNAFFIKSFKVFSDGGNFCPEEIEAYKAKLETIAIKVDKCEGTVMSDLEGIEAKRLEQATKIVAEFEDRFRHHMVDLKFMEKIARWLTNTQVKIKAEVAASNMAARMCADALVHLETSIYHCRTRNTSPPDQPKVSPAELYSGLINSFTLFQDRAIYLNALKQPQASNSPDNPQHSVENATSKVAFQTEVSGPKNTKIAIEDPTVSVIKNILKTQKNKSTIGGVEDNAEQILGQLGPQCNLMAGPVASASAVAAGAAVDTNRYRGHRSSEVVSRASHNDRTGSADKLKIPSDAKIEKINLKKGEILPEESPSLIDSIDLTRRGSKIDAKFYVFGESSVLAEQPALLEAEQTHLLGKITKILRVTLDGLLTGAEVYYRLKRERLVTRPQVLQETFEACATAVVNKLQLYFLQADEYHNKCILELREQVLTMEKLMVSVPELVVDNLYDSVVEKIHEEKKQSDEIDAGEINAFEKQKASNNAVLRPQLGHPQKKDELKELCSAESARSLRFVDSVDAAFCRRQTQLVDCGQLFLQRLDEVVCAGLRSLDTFITQDDLVRARCSNAKYPVAELLRRQKCGEQLEDPLDKGQLPRGAQVWPGFPKNELSLTYKLPILEQGETGQTENVDSKVEIQSRIELTPVKKRSKTTNTQSISTLKTTLAHSSMIAYRDSTYQKFKEFFEKSLAENEASRKKKLEDENRWIENWMRSTENVQSLYQ